MVMGCLPPYYYYYYYYYYYCYYYYYNYLACTTFELLAQLFRLATFILLQCLMFLSTKSKIFRFEITVLGQSAEFSLNYNICFFYRRDSEAIPLFMYIYIYNYFISIFNFIIFYLSPNKPNKPDFYQKLLYIINHYLIEFLQLPLT